MVERSRDLKDRLYLVVLLLIGAAAMASGLYYVLARGDVSAPIVFDTAFGVALLLVAWLFLLPENLPQGAERRPERLTQLEPLLPDRTPPAPLPRPLPTSRASPPARRREAPVIVANPPSSEPALPVGLSESTSPPAPRVRPPPPEQPPPPTVPASEVIKELDEIYADLQPAETEDEAPPPVDPRRRRLGGPAAG